MRRFHRHGAAACPISADFSTCAPDRSPASTCPGLPANALRLLKRTAAGGHAAMERGANRCAVACNPNVPGQGVRPGLRGLLALVRAARNPRCAFHRTRARHCPLRAAGPDATGSEAARLAALRALFDRLVVGRVPPINPAASVRGHALPSQPGGLAPRLHRWRRPGRCDRRPLSLHETADRHSVGSADAAGRRPGPGNRVGRRCRR